MNNEPWIPGLTGHTLHSIKEPPHVSDLYDTLENLTNKVETQCPVIPECVQSCLDLANYVLARVRYEREKK